MLAREDRSRVNTRECRVLASNADQLVDLLVQARRAGHQIQELDPRLIPGSALEGYELNERVAAKLGLATLGWKIAATTPEMQARLRATEPIYGRTFVDFRSASPARMKHAQLLDPIIECEFIFRLACDLPPRSAAYRSDEVASAVGAVHAGIEVAECRFPLGTLPPMPAILADGAASGHYVIGPEIDDWRAVGLAAMPVTLTVNGSIRRRGAGHEVMGDPINALCWLANARRKWGDGLKAGEYVSTGTATGMLLAKQGDRMCGSFGSRWNVDVDFE